MPELVGWLAVLLDVILLVLWVVTAIYLYNQLQAARRQHVQAETEAVERLGRAKEEADRIIEDARTYEQDTGVHVLSVGFPILQLPPGSLGGGRSTGTRWVVANP